MQIASTISRFKKEKYLKSLSEDEFRDEVVRPLFLRLGLKDGRDLCGPQEAGKDAIFSQNDIFGHPKLIAVQTKKGNLNLGSTASTNLIAAITQIRTALATEVVLLIPKLSRRPAEVYLCASGKINDAAKQHIVSQVDSPNIHFLDINELIPRIDEYLPELWLGIEADILPYFQAIRKLIVGGKNGAVAEDGVFEKAAADESFVDVNLYRTTTKTRKFRGRIDRVPYFEEFPLASAAGKKFSRMLILGDAGSGKSTGLLRIAYRAVTAIITEDGSYTIPILIRATDFNRSGTKELIEYCDMLCRDMTGSSRPTFTIKDLVAGRILLLLDSLDELSSNSARSELLDQVDGLQAKYPKVRVIAASRPSVFASEISAARGYEQFQISPISWRQAGKIVRRTSKGKKMSEPQTREVLRRLETLHGLELSPLLVTVFAATSLMARRDIPANITELFKKFTELMLGRWDAEKGLDLQYQANLKDFVLIQLAHEMHRRRLTSIDRAAAEEIVSNELEVRGYQESADSLLEEIFERSGLFRVVGETIEFQHLMIQEFFAGRGFESADQAAAVIFDEWWRRPLVFYFGENPGHIRDLHNITQMMSPGSGVDLMNAAVTVGLALQACYLSPVSEKLAVWRWVVQAASVGREGYISALNDNAKRPHLAFLYYYINGRDAVALTNLRASLEELEAWASLDTGESEGDTSECRTFWLISGLIESGEVAAAKRLVERFKPSERKYLLAIHLGCFLTEKVRPVNKEEKKAAADVCRHLDERIAPLAAAIRGEMGSQLIEIKSGELAIVDEEVDSEEEE